MECGTPLHVLVCCSGLVVFVIFGALVRGIDMQAKSERTGIFSFCS